MKHTRKPTLDKPWRPRLAWHRPLLHRHPRHPLNPNPPLPTPGGYDAMSVYNIEPEVATTPTAPPTTPTAPPTTASPISSDDKSEISSSSSASSEKEVYPDYRPSSVSTEPIFSEGRPSSAYYSSPGGETSHDATVGSHLGCYLDVRHDRLLRSDMTESEDMTPAVCGAFCGEGGSEVFSLQYSTE